MSDEELEELRLAASSGDGVSPSAEPVICLRVPVSGEFLIRGKSPRFDKLPCQEGGTRDRSGGEHDAWREAGMKSGCLDDGPPPHAPAAPVSLLS